MTKLYAMAMRRRSAFALCREYGIAPSAVALLLDLSEQQFLSAIYRDGFSLEEMQEGNGQLHAARKIMELLRKELETLSAIESESDLFGRTLTSSLKSAAISGKGLDDVLKQVAMNIAGMALNAGLKPLIEEFVEQEAAAALTWRLTEMMEQPERVELAYRDPMLDYQAAMAFAERQDGKGTESVGIAAMLDSGQAKSLAEGWMQSRRASRRSVMFELPWKQAGLKIGDKIRIADPTAPATGDFVITSIEDGATRRLEARAVPQHVRYPVQTELPVAADTDTSIRGRPYFELIDLPMWPGIERPADQFRIAAFSRPWSGVSAFVSPEKSDFEQRATLAHSAIMGELITPLDGGASGRWIHNQALTVKLYDGELSSATHLQLFNGANSALVGTPDGEWEILQFLNAEEISSDVWRLTGLLRGQCGTESEATQLKNEGAPFILLNEAISPAGLKPQETGLALNWRVGCSGEEFSDRFYSTKTTIGGLRARQPLSPVHIRNTMRPNGDMEIGWIRRGRIDADSWLSPEIPLGEDREAYHIEILLEGRIVRALEVADCNWTYSLSERSKDLGSPSVPFDFKIAMVSASVGLGQQARCKFSPIFLN